MVCFVVKSVLTPQNTLNIRIGLDPPWALQYFVKLEVFYNQDVRRPVEVGTMECDALSAEEDGEKDMIVRFDESTEDLNAILHPIGGPQQELRYFFIQVLQPHLARQVSCSRRSSRSGMRCSEAVAK